MVQVSNIGPGYPRKRLVSHTRWIRRLRDSSFLRFSCVHRIYSLRFQLDLASVLCL